MRRLLPLLAITTLLSSCRDASDTEGRSLAGKHVLAGRALADGGPRISHDDLIAGFFVSTDADLAPIEAHLRRTPLELTARLFGTIDATFRDSVVEQRPAGGPTRSRHHDSIDFHLSLGTLAAEYEGLCNSGAVSGVAPRLGIIPGRPCLPFDLGSLTGSLDEVTATLRRDEITVRWNLGRIVSGLDVPVLDITLPFTVDVDPDDDLPADPPTGTAEVVISAFPLPWNGVSDPDFIDFHGPGRHAPAAPSFLTVRGGTARDFGGFDGLVASSLGGVLSQLDPVVQGTIGRSVGGIAVVGADDEAAWCAARPGGCPFTAATLAASRLFSTVDFQATDWRLPDGRIVHLEGAGGVWTDDTVDVIALGAEPVTARVRAGTVASACDRCAAAGDAAACAACTTCTVTADPDLATLCAGGAIDVPVTAAFDPVAAIPAAPGIASLAQIARSIEDHTSRFFATPLVDYNRAHPTQPTSYVEFLACPAAPSCPAGESGAVFRLAVDPDGDGVSFVIDNCPEPNPDQANADGDAFGDVCDLCNGVVSDSTSDLDGDGTPDDCDCDADEDGCENSVVDIKGMQLCVQNGDVFDQRPHNANPLECSFTGGFLNCTHPADLDDDGVMNDCDEDDDGDGDLDGTDNCPLVANPGQEDCNNDGIGNACDAFCTTGSCSSILCDRLRIETIGFIEWLGLMPAMREEPLCLVDGPGCWILVSLDILQDIELTFRAELDALAERLDAKALGVDGVAIQVAAAPDLDFDGYADLVIAVPSRDELVGVSSASRQRLWTWAIPVPGEAGAALASARGELWIGAPGAARSAQDVPGAVLRVSFVDGYPRLERIVWGDAQGARLGTTIATTELGEQVRAIAGDVDGGFAILDGDGERLAELDGHGKDARAVLIDDGTKVIGLAIGARGYASGAGVVAFHDLTGATLWKVAGGAGDALGTAITFLETPQGRTIVAGAPGNDGYLLALDTAGAVLGTTLGAKGEGLGSGLARLADLDGDGAAELAVEYAGEWSIVSAP